MSAPVIAERTDIHRSCKTLEVVVNILNDYCEAATAIVAIQKKLAKALREAASTRNVSDVAANAFTASAAIFEAVCEVDNKFSKFADKECDGLSAEVKKWFKRLAKEERAHDERIANANYRIKQAGQVYEKNVKRNPADAAEEHSRYISLLSSLGPEITQDKQNHTFAVSQRHTMIMFSVAACMARVADAEWLRVCEGVRRISPSVGPVGEWRALCEGSWNGPIPADLPNVDAPPPTQASQDKPDTPRPEPVPAALTPLQESTPKALTPADNSPQPSNYFPSQPSKDDLNDPSRQTPASALPDLDDARDRSHSVNSIASLGSFPAPPTHFPLPPVAGVKPPSRGDASLTPEPRENSAEAEAFSTPKSSMDTGHEEPPLRLQPPVPPGQQGEDTFLDLNSPTSSPSNPIVGRSEVQGEAEKAKKQEESTTQPTTQSSSARTSEHTSSSQPTSPTQQQPVQSPMSPRRVSGPRPSSSMFKRGDYMDDAEFGVRRSESMQPSSSQASGSKGLERSASRNSNGSVVAAMRDKYSRSTGPASPPPRDVPRLPKSVPELANKWEYTPGQPSPSQANAPRSPIDDHHRGHLTNSPEQSRLSPIPSATYDGRTSPSRDEIARRRQRLQELEELDLREQELELRLREREIEQRARQLEQDRVRLLNARGALAGDGYDSDASGAGPAAAVGAQAMRTALSENPALQARHPYASSSTQLPRPREPQRYASHQSLTQTTQSPRSPPAAAVVASPQTQPQPQARLPTPTLTPPPVLAPLTLRPDKPEGHKMGWIRRLSMPVVGNAFSGGDSKKGISSATFAAHPQSAGFTRNSFAFEDGRLDKNRSVTNLGRR